MASRTPSLSCSFMTLPQEQQPIIPLYVLQIPPPLPLHSHMCLCTHKGLHSFRWLADYTVAPSQWYHVRMVVNQRLYNHWSVHTIWTLNRGYVDIHDLWSGPHTSLAYRGSEKGSLNLHLLSSQYRHASLKQHQNHGKAPWSQKGSLFVRQKYTTVMDFKN
jgi:hypothetical protein